MTANTDATVETNLQIIYDLGHGSDQSFQTDHDQDSRLDTVPVRHGLLFDIDTIGSVDIWRESMFHADLNPPHLFDLSALGFLGVSPHDLGWSPQDHPYQKWVNFDHGNPERLLLDSDEYTEANAVLVDYYGDYAHLGLTAVKNFSSIGLRTELCKLLSGLAQATIGKYKPVVSVNDNDGAFELETRLSPNAELFYEVSPNGEMEAVLYDDRRGAESLNIQSIGQLLEIVRQAMWA